MAEKLDAHTSATVRIAGKRGDGSGHQKIKVAGMTCQADVDALADELIAVEGVVAVKVFLRKGEAQYNQRLTVEVAVIKEAVQRAGFEFLRKV